MKVEGRRMNGVQSGRMTWPEFSSWSTSAKRVWRRRAILSELGIWFSAISRAFGFWSHLRKRAQESRSNFSRRRASLSRMEAGEDVLESGERWVLMGFMGRMGIVRGDNVLEGGVGWAWGPAGLGGHAGRSIVGRIHLFLFRAIQFSHGWEERPNVPLALLAVLAVFLAGRAWGVGSVGEGTRCRLKANGAKLRTALLAGGKMVHARRPQFTPGALHERVGFGAAFLAAGLETVGPFRHLVFGDDGQHVRINGPAQFAVGNRDLGDDLAVPGGQCPACL